jgi:hypothetical protein
MTAAEVYESVTNGGASDFADVATISNRNKPWCLIGGLAVNCYVEPVYTVDVNLVVVARNLPRIQRELNAAGFRVEQFEHPRVPSPGDCVVPLSLRERVGVRAMRQSKLNARLTTNPRYQDFLTDTTEREVLGLRVPVASLENIIRGKVWAWQDAKRRLSKRKKDELDLIRIAEAYPHLRQLIPDQIVAQLG